MPNVSIIMGVYNCKDFSMLKSSVLSIINQTYDNWEFIICNDGSTNDTLLHLNELSALDSRIKIVTYEENKGLAFALNYCLKYAKGKYIARQDDDDISYRERLDVQIKYLESHPEYDFVGSMADVYDNNGIWGEYKVVEKPECKDFCWNSPFIHPTIVFRQQVLEQVDGYRVAKETRRCEDFDLFMRLYAIGKRGYNIQKKLYNYRVEIDSSKKYRPMKYRIDEFIVRYKGYRHMGMLTRGFIFMFKPLLVGLIPTGLFAKIKRSTF